MKQITIINTIFLALLLAPFPITKTFADTTLSFINTNEHSASKESVIYIKDGKINFFEPESSSNSDISKEQYSIFDSKTQILTHINPANHSYIEIDSKSLDQQMQLIKSKMDKMVVQMKEELKKLPPEQRKIMQSMMSSSGTDAKMGGSIPGRTTAKKKQINTGKHEIVANINCIIHEIIEDYAKTEELCIANENKFTINESDIKTMISLRLFIKKISKITSNMSNGQETTEQFDGVPIRNRYYDRAGNLTSESTLISINRQNLPLDKVSIPVGYNKQSMQYGM